MPFTEDLDVFLADFGVTATAGAATFTVIHDRAYLRALTDLVESTGPQCVGKTSDLAALVEGTAVTVAGTAYVVVDNQPDGTGMTTLQLRLGS